LIESDMGPIPNGPPPRKGHKKQDSKTFKRKKTTKKKGGGGGGAEDESIDDDQRSTKVLVYHLIMEAQKKREQEESKKKQEEEEEKARRRKQEHEDGFSEDEEDNAAEAEEASLSLEERYNRLKLRYDKQLRNRRAAEAELQAFETLMVAGGKTGFEETLAFWREAQRMPSEERLRVLKEKTTDATPPPSWAPAHTPRRTRRQLGAELIRTESVMYDTAVPEAAREPSRPSLMFAKKVAVSFSRDLNAFLSANPGEITSSKAQAFLDSFKIHDIDLMKGGIIGGEDEDEEGVEEELMLEEGGYNHYEDLHFSDAEEVKKHQSGEMGKDEKKSVRKSVQKERDAEENEEDDEEDDEDDEDDDDDDGAIGELDESGRPIQRLQQTQQAIGQSRTIRTTAATTRTSPTPEGVPASGIQTQQQPPLRPLSTNIQPEEIQRLQKVVAKKQAHLDKLRAYLAATKQQEEGEEEGGEGEGHTNGHDARLHDLLTSERRGTNELFKMMKDGASLLPPDGDHEEDGVKHLSTGHSRRSAFHPAGKTKKVIDDHNKTLLSGSTGLFSSLGEGSRSMLREVSPTHEKEGEASGDVDVVDKERGEKKVVEKKKQHRRGNSIIRVKKPKEEQDGSSGHGHPATPTSPKKGGTFIHRRQASNK